MAKLLFPSDGFLFDTYTEEQSLFLKLHRNEGIAEALRWLSSIHGGRELSYPAELKLSWAGEPPFRLEISETVGFENPKNVCCEKTDYSFYNAKVGQTYFWRVNDSKPRSFQTVDNGFRFIRMGGARNVRDLGGDKIKQGMVFRGSELDNSYELGEEGRRIFLEDLKIRAEIDMRGVWEDKPNRSSVDGKVCFLDVPYRPYKEIFEPKHKEEICEIMEFLSDETHYPLYVHCMGGADRTGMIAMFLRAILGEDDENILLDYELTSLSQIPVLDGVVCTFRSRNNDYFVEFLQELKNYAPTGGLREQLLGYLRESGVKEEYMKKIVSILKKD